MTEFLRDWLLSVLAAAMVLTLLLSAMPKGSVRHVGSLAVGMVLFLVVLRPVLQLVPEKIMNSLESSYIQASAYPDELEMANESYLESIMSRRCEEYIISQAGAMGYQVEALVVCSWNNGYPIPSAATIWSEMDDASRAALEEDIQNQLNLLPEAITFEEASNAG